MNILIPQINYLNKGPNTNGSQFFITLAPCDWLNGKHAIFGRVASGMKIVQRIGLVQTDKDDRPVDDVKILKAYITPT
jgi:peptidyl-prolyl cis-trans isomerase-like 1